MTQALQKKNFKPGSLRGPRTARTVLLRMAADDERAQRINALKDDRPDLTWRRIAETVGVSERAAFEWKKTGGIEYENAEKLAVVFGVDVDYIWTGAKGETPDPFAGSIEDRLDRLITAFEQARQERETQADEVRRLLVEQRELLTTIRVLLGMEGEPTLQDRLVQMVRDAAVQAAAQTSSERRARS